MWTIKIPTKPNITQKIPNQSLDFSICLVGGINGEIEGGGGSGGGMKGMVVVW